MANRKGDEVVNGTTSHKQSEANHGDKTKKITQKSNKKKGQPRKKDKTGTQTPRVLRSRSQEKPKTPESVDASSQDVTTSKERKRKKMKKIKKDQNDEFSKIRTHLKYLLQKIKYEQLFIDAYAGEGWKGQSLEKLRPEKELQRAKSDINRFKLRIRDLFQKIDKSCEEGRFPETLYDSDGLIDSEDIFCAKCAQTEVRLDNDIILCDGFCDRGFHQYCLDPPLLKEQVPPGDEGWLCPACDCKVDCVDLLNDSMGTDLSINDSWEKVFPETAASGNNLNDLSGLPSDDSEDDDYTPDGPGVEDGVDVEDPSSNESSDESSDSDFSSASEDLGAVANNINSNNNNNDDDEKYLGLPSDDSEDDDFNPDKADSDSDEDEDNKTKSSESDFTSDAEDLADVSKNEVTSVEGKESVMSEKEEEEEILKTDMENDDSTPITARRSVQRLDYKKLHDEAYGNVSSDSSDEDFSDTEGPKRRKNAKGAKDKDSNQEKKENDATTPVIKSGKKAVVEGKNGTVDSGDKSGGKSSNRKKLGEAVTQRLYEIFKESQYPDRKVKESLTKELNLTLNQVSKWFENARRSFNHTGQARGTPDKPTAGPTPVKTTTKQANGENSTPTKSRKRKTKADNDDTILKEATSSPLDLSSQSARRSGRVRAKKL